MKQCIYSKVAHTHEAELGVSVGIYVWPKECAWALKHIGPHTHSLVWVQLLCMSTTNCYICFYLAMDCILIVKEKLKLNLWGKKTDYGLIFFFFGRLGDRKEWLADEREANGDDRIFFFFFHKKICKHMCTHAHASTQMDKVSQKVETSRHICIFQLERIKV